MTADPSDPIEKKDPDFDPGLAPDPKHQVEENPPEGAGPVKGNRRDEEHDGQDQ